MSPNVPEYAKSRPSSSVQTFTPQQTYFTAPDPQFQERDLGGVKKKLLIFFLNLGLFSIFSSLVGLTGGVRSWYKA